ncbi:MULTISPECIES: hypothetical protein [unclassified Sphingobium]|uniref:hypothetical protein n=1 Tax=unclassified Sphingobium TaxID=2611147 RepID=UPI000D15A25D|nr:MULTISPECIES: hypothetical protein [unclassified Sphingobium]MBG6120156.1 hypothetical protein [Sphingobium sp. JAI105]PSO12809.1 hypothetical protein C7E20_03340 [Sphingobium sp. AEW4]TWD05643.1 hypothetical protein FB595_1093 [Sphingobium sp. AEW010]TWD23196.1 hypothetical protein FB596_1093 [Sphingobium sp. AEW013]TWD25056.1 hypothetical protein FB594_1093 [Sphingobium sp. AEW001]
MFHQADLFDYIEPATPIAAPPSVALPDLVGRVSQVSKRPRYVLLVLNLIAKAAGENGSLGPYVRCGAGQVPVRDWLCQALAPLANRDCRRTAMIAAVRSELTAKADASENAGDLAQQENEEIEARILRSGRTNVSRAVSDLVRAGLLHRHYQGYRVDHPNRGAQREAVYTIAPDVRLALAGGY